MSDSTTSSTWSDLAAETHEKRASWRRGEVHSTLFVPCGQAWDAVAVQPLQLGVDALATMGLDPAVGYLLVADYLRGTLYVMIPPGSGGDAFSGLPGVRVLGPCHQLLMPRSTRHHSILADWVGAPDRTSPALVDPHHLAVCLRELMPAHLEASAA